VRQVEKVLRRGKRYNDLNERYAHNQTKTTCSEEVYSESFLCVWDFRSNWFHFGLRAFSVKAGLSRGFEEGQSSEFDPPLQLHKRMRQVEWRSFWFGSSPFCAYIVTQPFSISIPGRKEGRKDVQWEAFLMRFSITYTYDMWYLFPDCLLNNAFLYSTNNVYMYI